MTRVDEPFVADERTMLLGWLGWHRSTLLHKCAGLTGEQLALRPLAPSELSLLGLIRHHTDVERVWIRRRLDGHDDIFPTYHDGERETAWSDLDPGRAETDYATLLGYGRPATRCWPDTTSMRSSSARATATCPAAGSWCT